MNGECELKDEERQPCEVWTRVMGYHRPTTYWNKGKQAEHQQRKFFVESVAMAHAPEVKLAAE